MARSGVAWVAGCVALAWLALPDAPASAAPLPQQVERPALSGVGAAADSDCRRRYWRHRWAPYYGYHPYYRSWSSPSDYMANELNRQQLYGLGRPPPYPPYPYAPYPPYPYAPHPYAPYPPY